MNNYKVSIILMGGLGNQLFQIAAALNYAKRFGHKCIFPCDLEHSRNCTERNHYWNTINTTNLLTIENIDYRENYRIFRPVKEFYHYDFPYITGNVLLDGYFQTDLYVNLVRDDMINILLSNKEANLKTEKIYENICNKFKTENLISLHIRRGDYLKYSDVHTNLDIEYYVNAVNKLSSIYLLPIIVFSDDYEWCKNNLPKYFKNDLYFMNEYNLTDFEELVLMSKMRNNIIANSSFSWWAAYINNNKDKRVVAPSNWFANKQQFPTWECLYCKDWIVI